MTWQCAAIDHGITVFPFDKIGPCCQIDAGYLKPLSWIERADRFADLKTEQPPAACRKCWASEAQGLKSYRQTFSLMQQPVDGIQFVDLRNTNLCNFKCRYCGPHFSSQWSNELFGITAPKHTQCHEYYHVLFTESTQWLYNTGGEPLINEEHWNLLQMLVDQGLSHGITLMYNSNLSTLDFKNKNAFDLWQHFKSVTLQVSIDAIGLPLEYIRSNAKWSKIDANIQRCVANRHNIDLCLCPVISVLNVWFLPSLFEYADSFRLPVEPIILSGPDYLALDVVPDQCQDLALQCVEQVKNYLDPGMYHALIKLITNNQNSCLFQHTLNHIFYLDHARDERLFDLLPFDSVAKELLTSNHEYK